jgi:hypothetical protein
MIHFKVVFCLQIAADGLAGIHLGTGRITTDVYKTCMDSRVEFKVGWKEFLFEKDLSVGDGVLITIRQNTF